MGLNISYWSNCVQSTGSDIAVVTGASRGVGRGIAVALGRAGMTVYVTGRTLSGLGQEKVNGQVLGGNLEETAQLVTAAGGRGIPVRCDHADDAQVASLFEQVAAEHGRLDLLVNNATFLHHQLVLPGPFWEKELGMVDMLNVGLRSAYVASYYAVPLLLKSPRGLITFISSYGANCYMHGPAYGAQKAGCDKLAADMAVDLEGTKVAALSLWLGLQHTERSALVGAASGVDYSAFVAQAESPESDGRVIQACLNEPGLAQLNGQALLAAEQAARYGIVAAGQRQAA